MSDEVARRQREDDALVPPHLRRSYELPCGAVAHFDRTTGCSWRCGDCFAVVGSAGMPARCRFLLNQAPPSNPPSKNERTGG